MRAETVRRSREETEAMIAQGRRLVVPAARAERDRILLEMRETQDRINTIRAVATKRRSALQRGRLREHLSQMLLLERDLRVVNKVLDIGTSSKKELPLHVRRRGKIYYAEVKREIHGKRCTVQGPHRRTATEAQADIPDVRRRAERQIQATATQATA